VDGYRRPRRVRGVGGRRATLWRTGGTTARRGRPVEECQENGGGGGRAKEREGRQRGAEDVRRRWGDNGRLIALWDTLP